MFGLSVVGRDEDRKASILPFLPYRREQDLAVRKVCGQNRTFGLVEKIAEIFRLSFAHIAPPYHTWHGL